MKRLFTLCAVALISTALSFAQLNIGRLTEAATKTGQALTLTDAQVDGYAKQYIAELDSQNVICDAKDPYSIRLEKLISGFNNKGGVNIKIYKVKDVNAFACSDGSVRIYSGLMDIMNDDELLGIVGHELGHFFNRDTKNAFRTALLTSAAKDAVASTGSTVAALTDSQLGALGEQFSKATFSQKQEFAADKFGYEFLVKNGKNPWAMVLSFEKLLQLQGGSGAKTDAMQQLFSTHPDTKKRAEAMAKRATKEGYTRPTATTSASTPATTTTKPATK